jgi:hypothetical protein
MANVAFTQNKFTLSTATALGDNTYVLGDVSDGFVGTFVIQIEERVAGTCTFDVQGRSRNAATQVATVPAFVAIPYRPLFLNGSVGNMAITTTQITTDSLIFVPATGVQVALLVNWTDGEFDVYVSRMIGAAA